MKNKKSTKKEFKDAGDTSSEAYVKTLAGEMLQINITAFTNGKPLPYTKQQHTDAEGFSNEDAKCWNKCLPEAEQYIEIPNDVGY